MGTKPGRQTSASLKWDICVSACEDDDFNSYTDSDEDASLATLPTIVFCHNYHVYSYLMSTMICPKTISMFIVFMYKL